MCMCVCMPLLFIYFLVWTIELCALGSRWFPAFEEICMLNELCFVLQGSIATCIFMTFLSGIFSGLFAKCYEIVICFQKGIAQLKIITML